MRWPDIETDYPDTGESTLSGLLTHGARVALGLPASDRDRRDALRRIADRILSGAVRYDLGAKGALALLATLDGEWDLVGDATGGALPTRVTINKTYGFDLVRLARHVATVAYAGLPATHALPALRALRESFLLGQGVDPRAVVVAAFVFVRDIVRVEDPVASTRRWLEGEELEIDDRRPAGLAAPADGEEPRVKIFERFADELADDAAIASQLARHHLTLTEPWGRHVETPRLAFDELVIRAYVARAAMPPGWEVLVDPIVHAWLGGEGAEIERRIEDLALLRTARHLVGDWEDAVPALVVGVRPVFQEMVETRKLPRFRPGQFFKGDARKLLHYLASAIAHGATEADVLPAWLDFLSRRSPATTPRLTGEHVVLRWKHLLFLEAGIARVAGRPRGEVGGVLRLRLSGA